MIKKWFLAVLILLMSATFSFAADYYVRTDGHDTNCNGLTDAAAASAPNCAYLTIGKAISVASGSDTVTIADGTYSEGNQTISSNGTDGDNLLTFKGQSNAGADWQGYLTISGDYVKIYQLKITPTATYSGANITGDYVTFEDNDIYPTGNNSTGLLLGAASGSSGANATIKDNYIESPQNGMYIQNSSTNATIDGNEVNALYQYDSSGDMDWMRIWGTGHTVKNNTFHGGLTITGTPHVDCFQNWGWSGAVFSNVVIENNYCKDFSEGTMLNFYNATDVWENITVRNNIFSAGANGGRNYGIKNLKLYNNTFINISQSAWDVMSEGGVSDCTGGEIKNNIFYNPSSDAYQRIYNVWGACGDIEDDSDYVNTNLIFTPNDAHTWVQGDYPNDIVNEDPLFVNAASDHHLSFGSPAIEAGVTIVTVTHDKDGIVRPQGVAYEIGAYEFEGEGSASGTIIPGGCTESEVVSGGKTIVITLSGDEWVAEGATFDAQRQNIIDGMDSAQAEAAGWDAVVKALLPVTAVVRTNATTVTITLTDFDGDPYTAFGITANETVTVTIPATAVVGAVEIVATPTFQISAEQIGAEVMSIGFSATGPTMTYDANGPTITGP